MEFRTLNHQRYTFGEGNFIVGNLFKTVTDYLKFQTVFHTTLLLNNIASDHMKFYAGFFLHYIFC